MTNIQSIQMNGVLFIIHIIFKKDYKFFTKLLYTNFDKNNELIRIRLGW